jgi:MFS family permease
VTYSLNELAEWWAVIALPVLVFDQTGDALATTALFLGVQFVPAVLVPMFVVRVERIPPRASIAAIYCIEAAAFGLLAFLADHFVLAAVVAVAAVDGTLSRAGRSITRAVVAALLEPSGELRSGNAILNMGFTVGAAGGPAIAGLVVAGLGVQEALLIGAFFFLAMACVVAAGPLPHPAVEEGRWRERFRAGMAYVGVRVPLRRLLSSLGAAFIFFAAVMPIEVIYAKETLGAGDAGYGALFASWGIGMIAGSFVFAGLRAARLPLLLAYSTFAVGVSYIALSAAPTLLAACAISVIGGIGNGVLWVCAVSAIQEMTRSSMQARVMSVFESIIAAGTGVGFIVGGLIAAGHNPRATFLVSGIGVLVVLAAATRSLAGTPWTRGEGAIGPSALDEDLGRDMLKIDDPATSLAQTGGWPDPEEK